MKHEHLEGAGRIGRGFGIGLDPEAIALAGLDQSGGLHNNIRRQIVGRADPIVRPHFDFVQSCPLAVPTAPNKTIASQFLRFVDVMVFVS